MQVLNGSARRTAPSYASYPIHRAPLTARPCPRLTIARVGSLQRPLGEQQDGKKSDTLGDDFVAVENPVSQAYEQGYEQGYQAALKAAGVAPPPVRTQDSLLRSTLKSLTWRVASGATTMLLAWLIFKDTLKGEDALALGVGEFISKFILFFAHERAWALVSLL